MFPHDHRYYHEHRLGQLLERKEREKSASFQTSWPKSVKEVERELGDEHWR